MAIAAIYMLCLFAPTAVFAAGLPAVPAHCLTGDHAKADASHTGHGIAGHHDHSGQPPGDTNHAAKCCGLFAVTAIAPVIDFTTVWPALALPQPARLVEALSGRASDRIDRPPKSHPSL